MLLGESSFWHNNCFNWMGLPINHRLRMVLASLFINWLSHWICHPSVSQLLLENWRRFLADWVLQFWTIIIAKVCCMWGTAARIYIFLIIVSYSLLMSSDACESEIRNIVFWKIPFLLKLKFIVHADESGEEKIHKKESPEADCWSFLFWLLSQN